MTMQGVVALLDIPFRNLENPLTRSLYRVSDRLPYPKPSCSRGCDGGGINYAAPSENFIAFPLRNIDIFICVA